ncbi:hypothetical protein PSH58_02890 [Pseudomonas hefeiensis]|uniref:Lipoprotein n=1 Tax=Pseudomonas hefeiensis TaxID=2738125 RepID=A0ABY9GCD1_9PSED|nr:MULTISPECIES: hypothetical protein [unclassified Pseudomonas]WLH13325.1 hypothetical protein PSH57_02895 [Pseudomonas sp. FP205]WLH96384.1 hypothetical protein PSH58_02890 [Pseudomonas sp. FP53]WLI40660.1 hypothetical protein PSH74_02895 [Pseudomonas sp. FP821]
MKQNQTIRSFLARYLIVFMGVIFAGCFAASATVSLAMSTYFRSVPVDVRATTGWATTVVIAMVIVHSNYLIVRGRPWCAWVMVAVFAACLLTVLPTIQYEPHKFIYTEGVFWPLLGLLLLNSKRHREMRSKLVEVRRQRELFIQAAKTSRSRR